MGMSSKINRIIFPRCFHSVSCAHLPPAEDDDRHNNPSRSRRRRGRAIIKLIKSDGVVAIYDRPIKAMKLMEEHPKHMVCRSDSFYIGQKVPALGHRDRLLPGHNYFLLPANFFQSALSFAAVLRYRSDAGYGVNTPFEVERAPGGALRIKITDEMIAQRYLTSKEEEEDGGGGGVCTTAQLKREYEQLVGRRRHWKPKLDTIAEKKSKRKMRRKKKSNNQSMV